MPVYTRQTTSEERALIRFLSTEESYLFEKLQGKQIDHLQP